MNAAVDPRDIPAPVLAGMRQCPILAGLSDRASRDERGSFALDWDISLVLEADFFERDPYAREELASQYFVPIPWTMSLDCLMHRFRQDFPGWNLGWEDTTYRGWTGPMAWMNNGKCKRIGFGNDLVPEYRYWARTGHTVELAFCSLLLLAKSYQ